jgi:hypothetical protein
MSGTWIDAATGARASVQRRTPDEAHPRDRDAEATTPPKAGAMPHPALASRADGAPDLAAGRAA